MPTIEQIQNSQRSCLDCAKRVDTGPSTPWYCEASELREYLDDVQHERNTIVETNAARDFKHACGHEARWFVLKRQ